MDLFFFTSFFKKTSYKLNAIITDWDSWSVEPREDAFPHEFYHLSPCDSVQRLSLDQLGEVIDNNQEEFSCAWIDGKWTNNVYTPLAKGTGDAKTGKWHDKLVLERSESLTLRACFGELASILKDVWPI